MTLASRAFAGLVLRARTHLHLVDFRSGEVTEWFRYIAKYLVWVKGE